MYITYCKKCNRFSYASRIGNYCKDCKSPLVKPQLSVEEFSKLSLNERYRLAYKLTNNE